MIKKLFGQFILFIFALAIFGQVIPVSARENVTDWYIKDFQAEFVVNPDSTIDVTEKIIADCGNASDKHGIYRTLSTISYKAENDIIYSPVELIGITDFNGKKINYTQSEDSYNQTITWKIGDPNITVKGENEYMIKYKVKNVIHFDNPEFDEFYWNINGQFWDLEIDKFTAKIIFPNRVTKENATIDYYTGRFGSKDKTGANYSWPLNNILEFNSTKTLKTGEGITVSVIFPKDIFTPYKFTSAEQAKIDSIKASAEARARAAAQWQKFINILIKIAFLWPLIILGLCYYIWSRYGKDPKINPTIVPEFGVPDNLAPMEMGVVMTNGAFKNEFMSASIVNLAVNKIITIEKIEKKGIFGKEDYKIVLVDKDYQNSKKISASEKLLLKKMIGSDNSLKMSSLENEFYTDIPEISKAVTEPLKARKLIQPGGRCLMILYIIVGLGMIFGSFFLFAISWQIGLSAFAAAIIVLVFAFLMPQRTLMGAEENKKVLGFKLYMETAEKYRQRFNEKENIFEKFLPYAMIFGITGLWIEKMKLIYGEKYFDSYHPIWYTGAAMTAFDPVSINSTMTSLSTHMSSTLASSPSSSGSGGGGFSGGGGGGGGGGGW